MSDRVASKPDRPSILVVDDDSVFRERLLRAFEERGYEARGAGDGEAALALAREESPELATVDLRMPGSSGLDVVRDLMTLDPTTRIVVLTAYGSIATALEAVRRGAVHYLTKPVDADEILAAFRRGESDPAAEDPSLLETEAPSLARMEWEHINRVLADSGGNVSLAAKRLGIHRRSLQRKLSKFPVQR